MHELTPRPPRLHIRVADRVRRLAPDDYVEREPAGNVPHWRPLTEQQRRTERALRYLGIKGSESIAKSCGGYPRTTVYWARRLVRAGVGQDEIWNALMFGTTRNELVWISRLRVAGIDTLLLRGLLGDRHTRRTRRIAAKLTLKHFPPGTRSGSAKLWALMMNRRERRAGLRLVAAGRDPYDVGWVLGAVKDHARRKRAFQLVDDGIASYHAAELANALDGNALAIARTLVLDGNHHIANVIELARLADT